MARFLFVPIPVAGHLDPALTLVRGVVAHGHAVTVYTSAWHRPAVERAGATLGGRPRLIADFVRMGIRARAVQQEVAARRIVSRLVRSVSNWFTAPVTA